MKRWVREDLDHRHGLSRETVAYPYFTLLVSSLVMDRDFIDLFIFEKDYVYISAQQLCGYE